MNACATATVSVPCRDETSSANPASGATAANPASSLRYAPSSSSGFSPGCRRRNALSSTASPSTTEVFDWSAPERPLPERPGPADHGARRSADQGRRRRGRRIRRPTRRPAIVRPSAIAAASAPHAPSPGAATRNGRPVRTNEYRRSDPSSSRTPATARTCGADSSRTKASWSSIVVIVRP